MWDAVVDQLGYMPEGKEAAHAQAMLGDLLKQTGNAGSAVSQVAGMFNLDDNNQWSYDPGLDPVFVNPATLPRGAAPAPQAPQAPATPSVEARVQRGGVWFVKRNGQWEQE
jgi:hypothetical protein